MAGCYMGDVAMAVVVDRDFVRVGSKSYALNKINSIDVRERPAGSGVSGCLVVVGALVVLIALAGLAGSPDKGVGVVILLVGVAIVVPAYRAWKRGQQVVYALYLMTSSGEVQAVETKDRDEIESLRDRIEKGIAGVG